MASLNRLSSPNSEGACEVRDSGHIRAPKEEVLIVSESWLGQDLGTREDASSGSSEVDMFAAHDEVIIDSGKPITMWASGHRGRHAAHPASLDQLPETTHPPRPDDPLGGMETRAFAKARYRDPL